MKRVVSLVDAQASGLFADENHAEREKVPQFSDLEPPGSVEVCQAEVPGVSQQVLFEDRLIAPDAVAEDPLTGLPSVAFGL